MTRRELAAVAVVEALRKVTLCVRCHGDGFFLYFNSDGSGADKYDCECLKVKKALAEFDALPVKVEKRVGPFGPGSGPPCADCGHAWLEHRMTWEPYLSSAGPCAYPSDPDGSYRPIEGKEPCACKRFVYPSE